MMLHVHCYTVTFCMQQVLKTMLSNDCYQECQTREIVLERDYAENVFNMFLNTCHGHDADYDDADMDEITALLELLDHYQACMCTN